MVLLVKTELVYETFWGELYKIAIKEQFSGFTFEEKKSSTNEKHDVVGIGLPRMISPFCMEIFQNRLKIQAPLHIKTFLNVVSLVSHRSKLIYLPS